jgi:hypothetical protein
MPPRENQTQTQIEPNAGRAKTRTTPATKRPPRNTRPDQTRKKKSSRPPWGGPPGASSIWSPSALRTGGRLPPLSPPTSAAYGPGRVPPAGRPTPVQKEGAAAVRPDHCYHLPTRSPLASAAAATRRRMILESPPHTARLGQPVGLFGGRHRRKTPALLSSLRSAWLLFTLNWFALQPARLPPPSASTFGTQQPGSETGSLIGRSSGWRQTHGAFDVHVRGGDTGKAGKVAPRAGGAPWKQAQQERRRKASAAGRSRPRRSCACPV